jgi:hypothetical protein
MPLGRYFILVGSLLLGLLFAADWYMPPRPVEPVRTDVDRGIRIHSRHSGPARIVIDTSLPTIVPASAVAAELPPAAPPQNSAPRDAFALASPEAPQARPPSSSSRRKPAAKRRAKTPRSLTGPVARHEWTDSESRCLRAGERRHRIGVSTRHPLRKYPVDDFVSAQRNKPSRRELVPHRDHATGRKTE